MANFFDETDIKSDRIALPFSKKKQSAVLGHCLTDTKFFLQARNLIQPNWFSDPHAAKVYGAMLDWFKSHARPPTVEEMIHSSSIASEESSLRPKLVNMVHSSIHETGNFRLDALSQELTKWLRARIFYSGVHTSEKTYNLGKLDDAYMQMDKVMKEIKEATFLNEREASFASWRADFELAQFESQRGLTFGLPAIDDLLLPGNTSGGAPTGRHNHSTSPNERG